MKKVKVEDAIGLPILHDMTRIVPNEFKGVAFKRGHIIVKKDIPVLKAMGKENIYAGDIPKGFLHEEDCAVRIAEAICNREDYEVSEVSEGKINIYSKETGIFKIDEEKLYKLNEIEHVSITCNYNNMLVNKGEKIVSERIIPLYTKEENIKKLEEICESGRLFEIKKLKNKKVHLIITGTEVFEGTIEDKFYGVLKPKIEEYGSEVVKVVKVPDDKEWIKEEIKRSLKEGADVIICTGGMSVDEDDVTPIAIKESTDELVIHGAPVQPGNMFLLAYGKGVPVMGIPTAAIFNKYTLFDIVYPRLSADEKPNYKFFLKLAVGGLCRFCKECHYPNCTFGKGR